MLNRARNMIDDAKASTVDELVGRLETHDLSIEQLLQRLL